MNKKLTAKIQKLIPSIGESENHISSSIVIEPAEKELMLKKGNIYLIFDLASPSSLSTSLVSKMINDVLYDSYYHSDNISPIQSLEKALLNINEKITNLYLQTTAGQKPENKEGKLEFNMASVVPWGNVLYLVQFGKVKSYLMREGEIKEVNTKSEGNFSVTSSVIKEGDVIILSTVNFAQKFPPEKLLDSSLAANELEKDQSCLIIKFLIDTEFTENEVVDFNVKKQTGVGKVSGMLDKLKSRKQKKEYNDQPIATIASTPAKEIKIKESPEIKVRSVSKGRLKINSQALIYLFVILLVASLGTTLYLKNKKAPGNSQGTQDQQKNESSLTLPKEPEQKDGQNPEEDKVDEQRAQDDEKNKTKRIPAQAFYDIKLADANADPNNIAAFKTLLAVTDFKSGKIFTSDISVPKFAPLEQTFPGISNAVNSDGKLNFHDNDGYKIFDLAANKIETSYSGKFGITETYVGNIYSFEGDKIIKYVDSQGSLASTTWAQSEDFNNAKAISIAYNIYIATANNEIVAYTQGSRSSFKVADLEVPFGNITDMITDTNYDNMYVADAGNKRVVVLNSKGGFLRQFKCDKEEEWNDIRSLSVNADETKLYLLNSSRVFEIPLTE